MSKSRRFSNLSAEVTRRHHWLIQVRSFRLNHYRWTVWTSRLFNHDLAQLLLRCGRSHSCLLKRLTDTSEANGPVNRIGCLKVDRWVDLVAVLLILLVVQIEVVVLLDHRTCSNHRTIRVEQHGRGVVVDHWSGKGQRFRSLRVTIRIFDLIADSASWLVAGNRIVAANLYLTLLQIIQKMHAVGLLALFFGRLLRRLRLLIGNGDDLFARLVCLSDRIHNVWALQRVGCRVHFVLVIFVRLVWSFIGLIGWERALGQGHSDRWLSRLFLLLLCFALLLLVAFQEVWGVQRGVWDFVGRRLFAKEATASFHLIYFILVEFLIKTNLYNYYGLCISRLYRNQKVCYVHYSP